MKLQGIPSRRRVGCTKLSFSSSVTSLKWPCFGGAIFIPITGRPLTLPVTEILIAGVSVVSLLFGGGLFRAYIQHVKDLAVQKSKLEKLERDQAKDSRTISQLTTDIALMNQTLVYLKDALKPLENLPTLVTGFAVQTARITAIEESLKVLSQAAAHHHAD